jgi:dolichol-phosphate mannosyltransferase
VRLITIGIPVRNEELNIPHLITAMSIVTSILEAKGFKVEILVNDNASSDNSLTMLQEWSARNERVRVFYFQHGVTFQESILNLMRNAGGDAFVIYQSDLQDPFELIQDFVETWSTSKGTVIGIIKKRTEKFHIRIVRNIFYRLLKSSSDGKIVLGFQDFYLVPRNVYLELAKLSPEGLFLRGHISSRFSNISTIYYDRNDRLRGKTNFSFPQKYALALDGILLFGTRLIRAIAVVSMIFFGIGIFSMVAILIIYLAGIENPIKGWNSLAIGISLLISMFGIISSLILEYLIRIYRQIVFGLNSAGPIELKSKSEDDT